MDRATATIIQKSSEGIRTCASAARISTTDGTTLTIFNAAKGGDKDQRLIKKVLGSGHKSLLEHIQLTVAFDQVSVIVEQFMIEARLNSFTVKSRRYVDYSDAGYVIPQDLPEAVAPAYRAYMDDCFARYQQLLALEIPREDARYVLPYSFRSNFYMSMNARSLLGLIMMMTQGRGSRYPEIVALGEQLKAQLEEMLPGVCEQEAKHYQSAWVAPVPAQYAAGSAVQNRVELMRAPVDPAALLSDSMAFSGRIAPGAPATEADIAALLGDARPRELEELNYVFCVRDVSQAAITHFVRHRIQSIQVPEAIHALEKGNYVLPETVAANPQAMEVYCAAFGKAAQVLPQLLEAGLPQPYAMYFVLSGHVTDIRLSMNARELLHFLKLRTCTRAQWEIRSAAWQMLRLLEADYPQLFSHYGPSCKVTGRCPEGRLSCGKPYTK